MSNFKTVQTTLDFCKDKGKRNIKLIHTRLSNSTGDVNLRAIQEMKNRFGNIVAFGNHCRNPNVLFTSVAYEPTDYYFYVKDKKTENVKKVRFGDPTMKIKKSIPARQKSFLARMGGVLKEVKGQKTLSPAYWSIRAWKKDFPL